MIGKGLWKRTHKLNMTGAELDAALGGGHESSPFIISVTESDGSYSADKSVNEISSAIESHKRILIKFDEMFYTAYVVGEQLNANMSISIDGDLAVIISILSIFPDNAELYINLSSISLYSWFKGQLTYSIPSGTGVIRTGSGTLDSASASKLHGMSFVAVALKRFSVDNGLLQIIGTATNVKISGYFYLETSYGGTIDVLIFPYQ